MGFLNIRDNIADTLIEWFKRYLNYKIITLNNQKADKNIIDKALRDLEYAKNLDEIETIMKSLKNQIAIYPYFRINSYFIKWLINTGAIEKMEDINADLVLQWLTQATSSLKPETKLNYKNILINFIKFLEERGRYNFNINLSSWQRNLRNIATKTADFLTEEEIDKFLEALKKHKFYAFLNKKKEDTYAKALYTLAIKFALFGGLRISEIANLNVDDIYVNNELDILEIKIKEAKNYKYRIVTIPYSVGKFAIKEDLDRFLEEREYHLKNNCYECRECKKMLFISPKCKKLSSSTMERVLQKILKEAGIFKEKKGMHLLRHTHASYFYKKTHDVLLLKERLGHDNIKTTMRYTHLDLQKIKKSADAMR